MATKRTLRIGELIKREIADILCREIRNPKLGFVTVNDVDVTADLKTALVRISVLGNEEHRKESLGCLDSAAGFIQKKLSSRLRLRYIPKLQFSLDRSIDHFMRISQLLSEIKESESAHRQPEGQRPSEETETESEPK